jgi:hypothetical protein
VRTLTTQELVLLALPDGYEIRARCRVKDGGGTFQDLSTLSGFDWLTTARWGQSVDDQVATATITLIRQHYGFSLAPLMTKSPLNLVGGSYSALLQVGREVKLDIAIMPRDGSGSVTWNTVFQGYIHDVESASDPIEIQCVDLGARLQWRQIKVDGRTYSNSTGIAVETVMQSILDDNLGAGVVTLYTPVSPSWNIKAFQQPKKSILEALTFLARQIGWDVRYLWDNGTSSFRLTLYEPPRTKSVTDYTLSPSMYLEVQELRTSLSDIRNDVDVTFSNRAVTTSNGDYARQTVNAQDATSIAKYDDQWMEVAEDSASNIDTSTEATKMANAARDDLKEPVASHTIVAHLLPQLELGDLMLCKANGVHYDVDQGLAVTSVQHEVSIDKTRTTIGVRGKPSGPRTVWLEIAAAPGVAPSVALAGPPSPTSLTATPVAGGAAFKFAPPLIGNWDEHELHISQTSGFTPDATTYKARSSSDAFTITDLVPGATYYAKVVALDSAGNPSAASSQVSFSAGYVTPAQIQPKVNTASLVPNPDFEANNTPGAPPDAWGFTTWSGAGGVWGTDALLSSTAFSGVSSVKFPATKRGMLYSQYFVAREGVFYTLDAVVRFGSTTPAFNFVRVSFFDASFSDLGGALLLPSGNVAAANTWYRLVGDMLSATPAGTKYARVEAGSTNAGATEFYLDSVLVSTKQQPKVSAHYNRSTAFATAVPNATWEVMDFPTSEIDTHSAVIISTATNKWAPTYGAAGNGWRFVAPIAGTYQCCASVGWTSVNLPAVGREFIAEWIINGTGAGDPPTTGAMKRGTRMAVGQTNNQGVHIASSLTLAAGDVVQLRVYQATGGAANVEALSQANWITIDRIND